ncbi:MAG TPA: YoaK family protein [Candidatus Nanopelagicales bacterium]|nr:YoaK family protein [Candidatus Nanopelagicales bacterium]
MTFAMPNTTTPGVFALTGICGVIDAACFLKLGGVFAEIMTGNLMFAAFSLGEGRLAMDFFQFAVPLVAFTVGALAGGYVLRSDRFKARSRTGFVWTFTLVVLAAVLAALWQVEGTSTQARIVVAVLALAMGLQNALVLEHGVPDIATNVMTLTLVRVLSNWSIIGGDNKRWQYRIGSLAIFTTGAAMGAFLSRWGAEFALVAAAALYAVALVWLLRGRAPAVTP